MSNTGDINKDILGDLDAIRKHLDATGQLLVVLDAKGKVVLVNGCATRMLGGKADDILGQDWARKFIPSDARADVQYVLARTLKGETEHLECYESQVVAQDGKPRTIEWRNAPLTDADGKVVGALNFGIDITMRRFALDALRESEAKHRNLFDNAPIGIYRCTPDGRLLMANTTMVTLLGYESFDELAGRNLYNDGDGGDAPQTALTEAVDQAGSVVGFETTWLRKDGTPLYVRENARAVEDGQGNALYYEGTVEDHTDQKIAEERLAYHIRFERLMRDIATSLMMGGPNSLDEGFRDALNRLTLLMGVDRSYIYENDDKHEMARVTHEWAAEGIERKREELAEVGLERFPWCNAQIQERNMVHIPSVEALPPEAKAEKEEFRSEDVKSLVLIPLHCKGEVLGLMGFDAIWKERTWTDDECSLLIVVGEIFASALERKGSAAELADERMLFEALMGTVPDKIYFKDRESRFLRVSKDHADLFSVDDVSEVIGKTDFDFFTEEHASAARADEKKIMDSGEPVVAIEEKETWADGSETWVSTTKVPLMNDKGEIVGTFGISRDITQRKLAEADQRRLESRMQHAQKLESLGVLSGGIAHDFNNLLMGMLGHANVALMELTPKSPAWESVKQIETVALRAAELTNQLLAYAGKSKSVIRSHDLNALVQEMSHLLEVSISKKVKLITDMDDTLPLIPCDPVQVRQVVLNLITNASDALGKKKGTIMVTTGTVDCDDSYLAECYLSEDQEPGRFAFVEVADTGEGMSQERLAKIFDPFFTTKVKGHGLGLAAVLGIVRAHRGTLRVYSEPGKGTTFKILLPCGDGDTKVAETVTERDPTMWQGSGTVLVVDDDDIIRTVASQILQRLGFTCVVSTNSKDALKELRQKDGLVVAVLLDVTVPGVGCEAFLEKAHKKRVPVILMSGYNEQTAASDLEKKSYSAFLQKPFNADMLADKLREITTT